MNSAKPLVLVTGGAGYVGSTLIRDLLARGYRVRCLDLLIYGGKALVGFVNHSDFRLIKGDIRDKKAVEDAMDGAFAVIHLAAIVGDLPCQAAPKSAFQINFIGTQIVVEAAKQKGVRRFIFASTCSNYGVSDTSKPADEQRELNPVSLYAETKIDCEKYLMSTAGIDFHPTSLRYGTAFGISFRTRFDLLVNSFAYEAFKKREIMVFAANTWRPYVHVADMSEIMLRVLEGDEAKVGGAIFNAGATTQNHRKEEVVRMMCDELPDLKAHFADNVDDPRNYRVDCTKLERTIGFVPTKTVRDGVRELISSFRDGILTDDDFHTNNLDHLKKFFASQEVVLTR